MTNTPPVTAILPCHNSPHIEEAIASVHAQTHPNVELIVVDDASTDDTGERAARAAAEDRTTPFRIHHRTDDSGDFPTPTNHAAAEASGDYYAFLFHDDRWLPAYLERQVAAFDQLPASVGLQWTGQYRIDADGTREGEQIVPWPRVDRDAIFLSCWVPSPSACVVRAEAFHTLGGFDESLQALADWDFYLRMWRHYALRSIDEPLIEFRSHAGQLSVRGWDALCEQRTAFIEKHRELFERANRYQAARQRDTMLSELEEAPWA